MRLIYHFLYALIFAVPVCAEDKAILIGVGDYRYNSTQQSSELTSGYTLTDLKGIDKDLSMMRDIAHAWGFNKMTQLYNEQATLAAVRKVITKQLINDTSPSDRVLIYLSVHGSRINDLNGDEEDGKDEILLLYDTQERIKKGEQFLSNYLLDDEFAQLLEKIPSQNVWVIIDACHSGTSTRSSASDTQKNHNVNGQYKFVIHAQNPYPEQAAVNNDGILKPLDQVNYIALTASADSEQSQATENGSLFTQGLYKAIFSNNSGAVNLSVQDWLQKAQSYISDNTAVLDQHMAQISGNERLKKQILQFNTLENPAYQANSNLTDLVNKGLSFQNKLQVQLFRERKPRQHQDYMQGDRIDFKVSSQQAGYIYLFGHEGKQVRLLYPNLWAGNNRIAAGTDIKIPQPDIDKELIIKDVNQGHDQYTVLLSSQYLPLFTLAQTDNNGLLTAEQTRHYRRLIDATKPLYQSKGLNRVDQYLASQKITVSVCAEYRNPQQKRC